MAKSAKRKKQDKAKAAAKRAEAQRLRERAEAQREEQERLLWLVKPDTEPAEVAALLEATGMADLVSAGTVARMRLEDGVPAENLAETARILLSATAEPADGPAAAEPSEGALAFAVVAAHASGDEDAEWRHTDDLLSRIEGDWVSREKFAQSVALIGHPGRAAEILQPHLRDHPYDTDAGIVYADAIHRARHQEEPGEAETAALDRFADESGLTAVREAVDAYLERTGWGKAVAASAREAVEEELEHGRRISDAQLQELTSLAGEIAIWGTQEGDQLAEHDHEHDEREHATALTEFAADPEIPAELAKRASDWAEYAHYGVWLLQTPPDPGVWAIELVTGVRRYIQFPDGALGEGAPWTVWIGGTWPVDGIWRSTGTGVRLSPDEGDAVAEFALLGVRAMLLRLIGVDRSSVPVPEPIPFDEPDPRGVRLEIDPEADDEHTLEPYEKIASTVVSVLIPELVVETYLRRGQAAPIPLPADDSWLDQPSARLDGRTPRQAAAGADLEDRVYLEALLRQLEHEAGLETAAGEKPVDFRRLRAELGMDGDFAQSSASGTVDLLRLGRMPS